MTDNEMLNRILESVNNLGSDMRDFKQKVSGLESDMRDVKQKVSGLESDMKKTNNKLDKIDSEVSSLRAGQIDIRKEIKQVDKRVSDTYNLALDAWGTIAENRKWLETANG